MNAPPRSIAVISWLFIAVGVITFASGLLPPSQRIAELKQHPFEFGLIQAVRILATVAGAFMLCGFNWARWLLIGWLAFHVILSASHSTRELAVHTLLMVVVAYFLFQPKATAYFRGATIGPS